MREPLLGTSTWREDGRIHRLRAFGGLHQLSGNDRPYFSLTGEIHSRSASGGRFLSEPDTCGAIHREILEHLPKLADLAALHLSDDRGIPMHAEANGWYWLVGSLPDALGERYHGGNSKVQHWLVDGSFDGYRESTPDECLAVFARHCRVDVAEARHIRAEVLSAAGRIINSDEGRTAARARWAEFEASMHERWEQEAAACVERHGLTIYGDTGVTV